MFLAKIVVFCLSIMLVFLTYKWYGLKLCIILFLLIIIIGIVSDISYKKVND